MGPMGVCKHEGCGTPAICKGYCHKHYARWKRKGNTSDVRKNAAQPCEVEGCDRPRMTMGLCDLHRARPDKDRRRREHRDEVLAEVIFCKLCGERIPDSRRLKGPAPKFCSVECKQREAVVSGASAINRKRHYYRTRYGLTLDEVEVMLTDARCAICGTDDFSNSRTGRPDIDHDHKTGRVRGTLCSQCNTGIGLMNDNPALLRKAAAYLE